MENDHSDDLGFVNGSVISTKAKLISSKRQSPVELRANVTETISI